PLPGAAHLLEYPGLWGIRDGVLRDRVGRLSRRKPRSDRGDQGTELPERGRARAERPPGRRSAVSARARGWCAGDGLEHCGIGRAGLPGPTTPVKLRAGEYRRTRRVRLRARPGVEKRRLRRSPEWGPGLRY